jgi:hypothetical protein
LGRKLEQERLSLITALITAVNNVEKALENGLTKHDLGLQGWIIGSLQGF